MTERDLTGIREQAGGIDPQLDASANYAKAINETRSLARQQGQVMSATLDNNHLLYHTNKKLVAENRELRAALKGAEFHEKQLKQRIDALAAHNEQLVNAGGDRYKVLYQQSRQTLVSYLHDELGNDQLREKLDEMKKQAAELDQLPEKVTERELKDMDVIRKDPDEIREDFAAETQRSR